MLHTGNILSERTALHQLVEYLVALTALASHNASQLLFNAARGTTCSRAASTGRAFRLRSIGLCSNFSLRRAGIVQCLVQILDHLRVFFLVRMLKPIKLALFGLVHLYEEHAVLR